MASRGPLLELTRARLVEFVRDPGAVFWVFGFPILLAIGLGLAFRSRPPEAPRIAVEHTVDASLREALEGSGEVDVQAIDDLARALRTGRVDLVVATDAGGLVFRYDPDRAESRTARAVTDAVIQRALGREDVVTVAEQTHSEPGARYVDFLVPGLIGLNLMGSGMWGIGFAIVDSRKRRLLKRFAATPMNRAHFLLSFMLSRLVFLVFEVVALLVAGWLLFDVGVRGSVAAVGVVSLVGAASFSGLALLIGSRAESTEVGAGWMNFVQLPMWIVSGSFFSYERFPEVMHPVIRALPLTAVNDALRAVMNEGASLWSTWAELGVLAGWGVASFVVALRIFRWQ